MSIRTRGSLGRLVTVFAVLAAALATALGVAPGAAQAADELTAPAHDKTISSSPDENGEYTITLDVAGQSVADTESRPADVVIVLDTSNSMNRSMNDEDDPGWGESSRLEQAKSAISTLANGLLADNGNVRVSLVTFDGSSDASLWGYSGVRYDDATTIRFSSGSWTASSSEVQRALTGISAGNNGGGTNWEAGLRAAQSLLEGNGRDSDRYVVFISDGNAGLYYVNNRRYNGYTDGDNSVSGGQINDTAYEHAVSLANELDADVFSVGVGPQENVNHLVEFADDVNGPYYSGASEEDLNSAVSSILKTINHSQTYRDVSIVDTLSEYVALPEGSVGEDGAVSDARITVSDASGRDVTDQIEEAGDWALVVQDDGSLRVDLGEGYTLEDGYTYTVSFNVVPTQLAFDDTFAKGDQDEGADGFQSVGLPSNDSAWVEFSIVDTVDGAEDVREQDPAYYDVPTFEVPMSQLTIMKDWSEQSGLPDQVTVDVYQDGSETALVTETLSADNNWTASVFVPAGPSGHSYAVKEGTVVGWHQQGVSVEVNDGSAQAGDNVSLKGLTAQTATFTITNAPDTYTLLVNKVNEDGEPLYTAEFDFYQAGSDGTFADAERIDHGTITQGAPQATFEGLLPGNTYYLVETVVPAGYQLAGEPYKIYVTPQGTIEFASSEDGELLGASAVEGQERTYEVSFVNERFAGSTIPSTGGMGDVPLYALGVAAIAGSVAAVRKLRNS